MVDKYSKSYGDAKDPKHGEVIDEPGHGEEFGRPPPGENGLTKESKPKEPLGQNKPAGKKTKKSDLNMVKQAAEKLDKFFSKLLWTFDDNNNLFLFFAFRTDIKKGYASHNLLAYELYRRQREFPSKKYKKAVKINLNNLSQKYGEDIQIGNSKHLIYFGAVDGGLDVNGRYEYSLVFTFKSMKLDVDATFKSKKAKAGDNCALGNSDQVVVEHKFSEVKYCLGTKIQAFNLTPTGDNLKFISEESFIKDVLNPDGAAEPAKYIVPRQSKELKTSKGYVEVNKFLETFKSSKIEKKGGFNIATKTPGKKGQPKEGEAHFGLQKEFVTIDVLLSSQKIEFEYLSNYNINELSNLVSVTSENWKVLSTAALTALPENGMLLTRVKNPEDFVDNYFWIVNKPAVAKPAPSAYKKAGSETVELSNIPDSSLAKAEKYIALVKNSKKTPDQLKKEEILAQAQKLLDAAKAAELAGDAAAQKAAEDAAAELVKKGLTVRAAALPEGAGIDAVRAAAAKSLKQLEGEEQARLLAIAAEEEAIAGGQTKALQKGPAIAAKKLAAKKLAAAEHAATKEAAAAKLAVEDISVTPSAETGAIRAARATPEDVGMASRVGAAGAEDVGGGGGY